MADVIGELRGLQHQASERTMLDARGRRRPAQTTPGYRKGQAPRNKGQRYPADPPTVPEIVALLDSHPDTPHGRRNRALMVLLWRSGLRIAECLALTENDLNPRENTIRVRRGKGDKSRTVGMDDWGWQEIRPWLEERRSYPVGTLFCILDGPTSGRTMRTCEARRIFRVAMQRAGIRRRVHPHALRHALACELMREGVPLVIISRQLGHSNVAITTTYLQGISNAEVIETIAQRRAPVLPVGAQIQRSRAA